MGRGKIKFNYEKLQTMDMIICAGRSPFAVITRLVTSGWKGAFNHGIAVHTGMIFDLDGQKVVAEMQTRGLQINSLERYSRVGGRRWVLSIKRHQAYNNIANRLEAKAKIALDIRRTLKYDYKGLVEFVDKKVKDNPKRAYCSEYYYQVSKDVVSYPKSFDTMVSPHDLQVCAGFFSVGNWCK